MTIALRRMGSDGDALPWGLRAMAYKPRTGRRIRPPDMQRRAGREDNETQGRACNSGRPARTTE
jgi:hypothetical protein